MSDIVGKLQFDTVCEIFKEKLPVPVKAELIDISMVPLIEVSTSGPDELGICLFEKKFVAGTLWKQGPFTVRITAEGRPPYLRDFDWPID